MKMQEKLMYLTWCCSPHDPSISRKRCLLYMLYQYIARNDVSQMREVISLGCPTNELPEDGSLIEYAIQWHATDCVIALMDLGLQADPILQKWFEKHFVFLRFPLRGAGEAALASRE
jgi:hypothetical protein